MDNMREEIEAILEKFKKDLQLIENNLKFYQERFESLEGKCMLSSNEIEQILGKALGYPWFKDDQKNFPGTTEADGVCVGEHVPETIAAEAANKIRELEKELNFVNNSLRGHVEAVGSMQKDMIETARYLAESLEYKDFDYEQSPTLLSTLARKVLAKINKLEGKIISLEE